ncbi:MAG: HAMP domain-containing histidine kinase [Lachnospiraceae bacterium]|nr:HAMP domain-containing histidine kinase [Lachnospiraceae bacterium]
MGWLKRKWRGFRDRLFHLSLKKALAVYIVLGTAATLLAIMIVESFSQDILNDLKWKYQSLYMESLYEQEELLPEDYGVSPYGPEFYLIPNDINTYAMMDSAEQTFYHVLEFIQSWGPILCIVAGVAGICLLFYRNKLKAPLELLTDSAEKIAANDLDFTCEYGAEDEMGRLCAGFEKMRRSLKENYQRMWDMMEEQRRLNHAFAHDLRTPLTVLHGYIDFLGKYYPDGKIGEEKLMETLAMMDRQVLRLRRFGDTMKSVGSLEERKAVKRQVTGTEIFGAVRSMAEALEGTGGVHIWAERRLSLELELYLDEELFLEVAENILSNGIRYAKRWVQVILTESGGFLELYAKDDGPGFTEEGLRMAAKPYYKDKEETGKEHFGIGLYVCRVLCEKHGGFLSINNSVDGGALVSAAFEAEKPEESL